LKGEPTAAMTVEMTAAPTVDSMVALTAVQMADSKVY
jgi:hypothetical protein